MLDNSEPLEQLWADIVEKLTDQSGEPSPSSPSLTTHQRAFLKMVRPILHVDGYLLLAARNDMTKRVVENDLTSHIASALQQKTGEHCNIAVTVQPEQVPSSDGAEKNAAEKAREKEASVVSSQANPGKQQPLDSFDSLDESAGWKKSYAPVPAQTEAKAESEYNKNEYTFENFVIGESNRFANGAAVSVAENPGRAYNPFLIFGGSGLGKTHLLHAIANYSTLLKPKLKVKYITSEDFTNDFINAINTNRREEFKQRYRNLDILIVDDIQFLQGKEGTQQEFFHTFNALHQANKQIVLSSDRPVEELVTLEDRLRTRFKAGLFADITPPDLETRIAILIKKAAAERTELEHAALEYIASSFPTSIRELEGGLLRVIAYAKLYLNMQNGNSDERPISLEVAEKALQHVLPESDPIEITSAMVMEVAADYFDLTVDALRSKGRKRNITHARHIAIYLCRELTDLSLPAIGKEFGRDHSTVLHSETKIRTEMNEKHTTYQEVQAITSAIKNRGKN